MATSGDFTLAIDTAPPLASDGAPVVADVSAPEKKSTAKRITKKGRAKKAAAAPRRSRDTAAPRAKTAGRVQRSFPASSFEEAMELATTMHKMGTDKVRRLTLFDHLDRSADSGPSRQLIINSGRYGITTGGVRADFLALTEDGSAATDPDAGARSRQRARFKLAIEGIEAFKDLYSEFVDKRLPSQSIMRDFLREKGYAENEIQECIDTFIVNAKFLGLLRSVAGAERLLSMEHVLDEAPSDAPPMTPLRARDVANPDEDAPGEQIDWSRMCFYVSPIGADDSEHRKHADLFLGSFVEPALRDFDLDVVRADQITKAGMITAQVIEHLANARVVVADLSFHNPNVFYEVALRHATRKPIVQIIRASDTIPFDLDQIRTIRIDTADIFTLVPQIETYRSEIALQVRRALEGAASVENPITVFYPGFWEAVRSATEAAA